jgi:hypothetical protein
MRFPTQQSSIFHANNPYTTVTCDCGQHRPVVFGECFLCQRKEGCDSCMVYVDDKLACESCAADHQAELEHESACCSNPDIAFRSAYAIEPHGESHFDEWRECLTCGTREAL